MPARHRLTLLLTALEAAALLLACRDRAAPTAGAADAATAGMVAAEPGVDDAGDAAYALDAGAASDADAAVADAAAALRALRHKYKVVLHMGDSEVGFRSGLTRVLERKFKDAGVGFVSKAQTGVGIPGFALGKRLAKEVEHVHPQAVILNLGTNSLGVPHPEALAPHVKSIARQADGIDCFWIGPPHLASASSTERQVIQVIADNAAPCRFFDSSVLELPMQADHIHPTGRGSEMWGAQAFHFVVWSEPPRGPFRALTP